MTKRFENEDVPIKKGLIPLLKYLKKNNYKTIVATSSNRNRVDTILLSANIEKYYNVSICGDEVIKGKPNPEVFLKSYQKLGVNTDVAIVSEDSKAGIQVYDTAHIKVICFPEPEYVSKTYKILNDLDEVKQYLETL